MTRDADERSRFPFPFAAATLAGLMIYTFTMEMHAFRWGIINHVMEDFAFAWTPFVSRPWPNLPRLLSHTFLHANTAHITGNLIFFALFAPAVERSTGHILFAVLYLIWGVSAACTQGFFEPYSSGMIGASGAISGAAGAYFVLYPLRTPPSLLMRPFGKFVANIPAFFWIGLWFLAQLKGGFRSLAPDLLPGERVAYWAHVGGFAAGALSVAPFLWRTGKKDSA
jgi:membrane associated rhomboid family serine protease